MRVRANVSGSYRRGGLDLSGGREVEVNLGTLTPAQRKALDADPRVVMSKVATAAPAKKAQSKKAQSLKAQSTKDGAKKGGSKPARKAGELSSEAKAAVEAEHARVKELKDVLKAVQDAADAPPTDEQQVAIDNATSAVRDAEVARDATITKIREAAQ